MMMPVATGILQRFPAGPSRSVAQTKFCKAVILGVTYATPIGGMSTLTGTGVNLILVGMWKSYFPDADPISFNTWSFFALPMALLIFFVFWVVLCLMYCPKGSGPALSTHLDKTQLRRELNALGMFWNWNWNWNCLLFCCGVLLINYDGLWTGPMAFAEKTVVAVFSVWALNCSCWFLCFFLQVCVLWLWRYELCCRFWYSCGWRRTSLMTFLVGELCLMAVLVMELSVWVTFIITHLCSDVSKRFLKHVLDLMSSLALVLFFNRCGTPQSTPLWG